FKDDRKFFVKGITYGPFKPDAAGNYLGPPERAGADLTNIRDLGFTGVRAYHSPPLWLLDACSTAGLRMLVTLPWAKHIEFLRDKSARKEITRSITGSIK